MNYLVDASFLILLCLAKHGKAYSDTDIIKTVRLSASNFLFHDLSNKDRIIQQIFEMPFRDTVKDPIQH